MGPASLQARWFDGRSSRARPVALQLWPSPGGPELRLQALDGRCEHLAFRHGDVGWPERWSAGRAPPSVMVDLGRAGSLQIDDPAAWQAALALAGRKPPLAERMQTRLTVLLAVLVVAAVAVAAFYRWGTPWAAAQLTRLVPMRWEQALGTQALAQIDENYVKPSQLAPARQAELRQQFDRLAAEARRQPPPYRHYQPELKLLFRSGMPANAFALPGGTIVMTDAMVARAAREPGTGDTALMGVLAHEIGHVEYRHTTRLLVEQGVLQAGLGLALGDVSSLISSGSALLTGLSYQRRHETQSDCYAVQLMHAAHLPTAPMADLLLAIGRDPRGKGIDDSPGAPASAAPAASSASAAAPASVTHPGRSVDWLNTHPDTAGRAQRIKAGEALDCG